MRAIELSTRAYIDLPGASAGELSAGFSVQLWVRPTAIPAVLLEMGKDGVPGLRLAMDPGGALELGGEGQRLTAPGAVAAGRWTHIAVELAADGSAAIFVDGFRAAAGALARPGDVARLRIGDATAESSLALADVRLFARTRKDSERSPSARPEELLAHYDGELDGDALRDAGPRGRHGRVVGVAQVVAAGDPDALAVARPGSLVWDEPDAMLEMPALTTDFTRGITIEAWIRPRSARERMSIVELGLDREPIRLMIEPERQTLRFDLVDTALRDHDLEARAVVRPDQWQHVCISIDAGRMCRVFVDGRVAHEAQLGAPAAVREGARRRCTIGRRFLGEMAELRVWQGGRSLDEVHATWLRRARGDEERLVVCYHLDTLAEGLAYDAGTRRLHARPLGGLMYDDGHGLPLRACADSARVHVRTAGKLLLDELPLSLFPTQTKVDGPWGMSVKVPVPLAAEYGKIHGNLVRCPVYEVAIEPRAADGTRLVGEVEVRVDGEVTVVRNDGGKQRLEVWKPGSTQRLAVRDSGRARVRVLAAKSLDCPALRVRAAGMDADCWALVRPADAAQSQLRDLSAAALRRPPPGKTPVLRTDMKDDDAEAIAKFMNDIGRALPQPPRGGTILKGQKLSLGDIWKPIEGAGRAVGSAFVDLGDDIAKLTLSAAEDAQKLVHKAAGAAVRTGEAAIRGCIKDARDLAVDSAGATWGAITVVGEMVVDGAKKMFRTVVAGVLDVAEAIEAFLRRIGAKLRDFIEFLAMLFDWERFLKKSDELYDLAREQVAALRGRSGELRKLPALLDELVAMPRATGLAGKTIGQAFGVDPDAELSDIDQLNYLVDVIEEAFSSSPPKFDRKDQPGAGPKHLGASETKAAHEATVASLPPELLSWRRGALDVPMDMFLDLPQKTWNAGRSVVEPMADWIADQGKALVERAEDTLTARLDVPYLTEMIELVILRGRKLDLLRLIALLGAVPAVVGGASRKSTATSTTKSAEKSGGGGADRIEEGIRWTQFGISVFNSAFFIGRTVSEWKWHFGAMFAFNFASGATTIALAALDLTLAARFVDPAAKGLAVTHALLAFFGGAWMIGSTAWAIAAPTPEELALRDSVDGVLEGVLGVGEVTTTIVAGALEKASQEELGTGLGVKLANWTLRGMYRIADGVDNTRFPFAHGVTTACAVAILVVDLGEALWSPISLGLG